MKSILGLPNTLLTLTAVVALSARAATPTAEQILPDDTLAMITVPDCAKLRTVSTKSPMGQLWDDPAMKPFRDKFMTKFNDELIKPLERELSIKLDDYAGLAQGQLTIALTANGWLGARGSKPAAVLLLDTGDKRAELERALKTFGQKWTDAGKTIRTEQVRGLEFVAVKFTTNDVPATVRKLLPGASEVKELGDEEEPDSTEEKKSGEIFFGRSESVLVVGDNVKALERVVSRLTGGSSPALAEVAAFQNCQPVFFREAHVFGWVNAQPLVKALGKMSEHEAEQSEEAPDPFATIKPEKVLNAIGVNGLRSAAFAMQVAPEGSLIQFHLGVPEAERKGVFKIIAGEAKETVPPPFVPADVVKFSRWRMDGQKAWGTLTSALNEVSPMIMSVTDYFLKNADELGRQDDGKFDMRRQLIENFSDDLISFEKKPRDPSNAAPSLVMIGSKAPEDMAAALKVLFSAMSSGSPVKEREFLGRKIYAVNTLRPQMDPTNLKRAKMHLSYTTSYVLIANDEAILEECLRSAEPTGKALGEVPGMLAAAQKVTSPGSSLLLYENQRESQRAKYEQMKRLLADADKADPDEASGMTPIPESFGMALPQKSIKEWFAYSLLPPFDDVAKYYGFFVMGGNASADGLTLKIFAPVPAEFK